MQLLVKLFYGLFGSLYLTAGLSVFAYGTGLLPNAVRDLITGIGKSDLNSIHIMQEFGSVLVFVGLITFWFIWHYERSQLFHWFMTAFWGLFALVHWFDVQGPFQSVSGPLANTVPFTLFAIVGVVRQWLEIGSSLNIVSGNRQAVPTGNSSK